MVFNRTKDNPNDIPWPRNDTYYRRDNRPVNPNEPQPSEEVELTPGIAAHVNIKEEEKEVYRPLHID